MSEALQKVVLDALESHGVISDTRSLILPGQANTASTSEDQIIILGALNSLLSREVRQIVIIISVLTLFQMITYETHENIFHVPTTEGTHILQNGSHEARVWSVLPMKGQGNPLTPVELKREVGNETASVGQGRAFKNGWIGKEGNGLVKLVSLSSRPRFKNQIAF